MMMVTFCRRDFFEGGIFDFGWGWKVYTVIIVMKGDIHESMKSKIQVPGSYMPSGTYDHI